MAERHGRERGNPARGYLYGLKSMAGKEENMSGILYGIGVGPGDPGLLTLKAQSLLNAAKVLAVPVKKKGMSSTALGIVEQVIQTKGKTIIELEFPMEHSRAAMEKSHTAAAGKICEILEQGTDVVLITLGDVSVYSTCTYVLKKVKAHGYKTEIVPGIPSFCSGAARAGISLVEGHENMAVVSGIKGKEAIEAVLDQFDNVVLMKAGAKMELIAELLDERNMLNAATVLSNIGMEDEYIGPVAKERGYGYFTTVIIKKGRA
ncbi:MAG: precorrin-2 C(20)-methyltransferase [Clostridiales bacterium]|nr:precorrin-2 C(20)-methyltransferase [Clostridiales bacterium]